MPSRSSRRLPPASSRRRNHRADRTTARRTGAATGGAEGRPEHRRAATRSADRVHQRPVRRRKDALAEHFLTPLRKDQRLVVMSGRCYDRESVPFKALDALIDALGSYLRSLPDKDAALLMPDDMGVLAQVFPVLQRVSVVAEAADPRLKDLDDQQLRQRAFRALRSLLVRISRRSPTVWFIDDLQWGDADSAQALFEVLRPPEAPAVLFLGTFRSDETEGSAFLSMWRELQTKHDVHFADSEVKVAPLTVEECTALVIRLIGQDDDVIRRRASEFAQETHGNPFLLIELIGCFDPHTDSFEPLPLHEVLARKLGQLPEEAAALLDVVAVSGQGLSLEEASRTAGHALPPVATITRMRNERLVRLIGSEESPLVDTYHDRVRETVLRHMDERRCQTLHGKLAEVIEGNFGGLTAEQLAAVELDEKPSESRAIPRVFDLAYHFDAAAQTSKARRYALLAAEQARRQSALEVAANNYAIAQRHAAAASPTMRYRIAEGWGDSLMLLGRYEEAHQRLVGIIELVDDPDRKSRINALQGEIAFKQGAISGSIEFFEQGLERLGQPVPKTRFGYVVGILRETLIQCGHSLWPGRLHRMPFNEGLDLTVRLLFRHSHPTAFQNTLKMLWSHLAAVNRAELVPPSLRLAYMYAFHVCILSMLGWSSRGSCFSARSLAIARECNDLLGIAYSSSYTGIGRYVSADYKEGLACLTDAINAFTQSGDLWELNLAHFHRGCCQFGLGNLAEAVADASRSFAASARLGDSRTLCSSYLWARATRGNLPFEQLKSCYPCRPDDIMSTVHGLMAEGHWHRFHGRTADSLQKFEQAVAMIRENFCINSHMIVAFPELAAALRLHAATLDTADRQACQRLRRRASRIATWSARIMRLFPAADPLALRELSLILQDTGQLRKALKIADRSCAIAAAQNARFEHAQSLLARGRIARQSGQPDADEQIRTAESALAEMEQAIPDSARQSQPP
ncbi:MAG: AAA family ATPase [Planctomycetaceae bacterium]